MRLIFIASGDFALPTLEALAERGCAPLLVITQPDRRAGRGKRTTPTPVKTAAMQMGIEVVEAENINDAEIVNRIAGLRADVGVVIAFGQKIKQPFRSAIRGGCINLHASLLPKLRGAAPFQRAVLNGDQRTGVTVFKLVDRMDAGAILTSADTDILPNETASDLHDRLALLGPAAVFEALALFADEAVPEGVQQDDSQATLAPKLAKSDGRIVFDQPAVELVRRIHGLWSWPGASCRFVSADGSREEVVTLARVRLAEGGSGDAPGVIDERHNISLADGALEIVEIKPQSGKLMPWRDYMNGRRVQPGDRFVSING